MDRYFRLFGADGDFGAVYGPPEISWDEVLPRRGPAVTWTPLEFTRRPDEFTGPLGDKISNDLGVRLCSLRLKAAFQQGQSELDTIQWLPAFITDFDGVRREYSILHFLEPADVLNESATTYNAAAGTVIKPVLSPQKVHGHKLFTLPGLEVTTVVHEDIKKLVETAGIDSVEFLPTPCR